MLMDRNLTCVLMEDDDVGDALAKLEHIFSFHRAQLTPIREEEGKTEFTGACVDRHQNSTLRLNLF